MAKHTLPLPSWSITGTLHLGPLADVCAIPSTLPPPDDTGYEWRFPDGAGVLISSGGISVSISTYDVVWDRVGWDGPWAATNGYPAQWASAPDPPPNDWERSNGDLVQSCTARYAVAEVTAGSDTVTDWLVLLACDGPFEYWFNTGGVDVAFTLTYGALPLHTGRGARWDSPWVELDPPQFRANPCHAEELSQWWWWEHDAWTLAAECGRLSASDTVSYGASRALPTATITLSGDTPTLYAWGYPPVTESPDAFQGMTVASVTISHPYASPPWDDLDEWSGGLSTPALRHRPSNPTPGHPYDLGYVTGGPVLKLSDDWDGTSGSLSWSGTFGVSTTLALDLKAFDIAVPMLTQGLTASSGWWEDPLAVPGVHTVSGTPHSWYSTASGFTPAATDLTVTFEVDPLAALDLPEDDTAGILEAYGLNRLRDTLPEIPGEGEIDEFDDVILLRHDQIRSVQWAEDDRSETAPPSWWKHGETDLTRSTAACSFTVPENETWTIERTLREHYTDRWSSPGWWTAQGRDYAYEGYYHGRKHKRRLMELAGAIEGHAAIVMEHSEDVYSWDWRYLRVTATKTGGQLGVELTVAVTFIPSITITDSHETDGEDRLDAYEVAFGAPVTRTYTCTLDADGYGLIDLQPAERLPMLIVQQVTIGGFTAGDWTLSELELVAWTPGDPVNLTTGRAYLWCAYPRPINRFDENLEVYVKLPDERTGAWGWNDGHCALIVPDGMLHDVGIAPDGLEVCDHLRGSTSSIIYDKLLGLDGWAELGGPWGQEGWTTTIDHTHAAVLDADDAELPSWMSDVAEIRDPVSGEVGYRVDENDRALPWRPRSGTLQCAQGMNWCLDGGETVIFRVRKTFYGGRWAYVESDTVPDGAPFGTWQLQERNPDTAAVRAVDLRDNDTHGLIRFWHGVNERCAEGDTRPDFRGGIAPDPETPVFDLAHYQVIPGWIEALPLLADGDVAVCASFLLGGSPVVCRPSTLLYPGETSAPAEGLLLDLWVPEDGGAPYRSQSLGAYREGYPAVMPDGEILVAASDGADLTLLRANGVLSLPPVAEATLAGHTRPCLMLCGDEPLLLCRRAADGAAVLYGYDYHGEALTPRSELGACEDQRGALQLDPTGVLYAAVTVAGDVVLRSSRDGGRSDAGWDAEATLADHTHPTLSLEPSGRLLLSARRTSDGVRVCCVVDVHGEAIEALSDIGAGGTTGAGLVPLPDRAPLEVRSASGAVVLSRSPSSGHVVTGLTTWEEAA